MTEEPDDATRRQRSLAGRCPGCGEPVRNWHAPERNSAAWQTLHDRKIDPQTGHRRGCKG